MRSFIITNIHGCLKTFQKTLENISLTKSNQLFLLCDYINKGPDSKEVLDQILLLQQEGYSVQALRGNHDQMLLDGV